MMIEEMKEKRIMQLQLGDGKLAKVVTIRLDRKKNSFMHLSAKSKCISNKVSLTPFIGNQKIHNLIALIILFQRRGKIYMRG